MDRKIASAVPNLTEEHREKIREAAERHGFEVRFLHDPSEDSAYLNEAEIIFGHLPEAAETVAGLKWICSPYAGVDQFPAPEAFANPDAMLSNSSGAYGVTIAEHVVMMLLEILRRQPEYRRIVAAREWKRDLKIRSIRDSRITLLGTGDIGQETAARLRAFLPACLTGVNRSGKNPGSCFDRVVSAEAWESVLPKTDILIISLPGTKQTFHMVGKRQLSLLPDGAVIINVGRGSVADQAALFSELKSGRLYAGLDVFEEEPIPADDPAWDIPNLLITPHTAGNMTLDYTVNRIVELFLEDLDNYCAGNPLARLVDRSLGY